MLRTRSPSRPVAQPLIRIFYGSQTGTAENYAKLLAKEGREFGLRCVGSANGVAPGLARARGTDSPLVALRPVQSPPVLVLFQQHQGHGPGRLLRGRSHCGRGRHIPHGDVRRRCGASPLLMLSATCAVPCVCAQLASAAYASARAPIHAAPAPHPAYLAQATPLTTPSSSCGGYATRRAAPRRSPRSSSLCLAWATGSTSTTTAWGRCDGCTPDS